MMEKKQILQKLRLFEQKVMDFYRKAGREALPWRRENITAYEVWVSEVMLQQTQVSRVIGYYEKFLKRFPTVSDVARANWEEFLPYYAGLGYYRRGRNMLATAQKIMSEFDSEFPRDKKLLMTLPGVGEYTASAILSFAYGDNHVAWDTNLVRVTGRYFFGSKEPDFDKGIFEKKFTSARKELNAALMDFGSAICLGRPKCKVCPLAKHCAYFLEDGMQEKVMAKDATAGERKINWQSAQVHLWLHRDHTLYYSSRKKQFAVFILSSQYNDRSGIKAYFKEKYGLELAVRPPHKKLMIHGRATLLVNAQILSGEPAFATFSKDAVKKYNESIICNL